MFQKFLSQKRTKLRALSEKDTQVDMILDLRDFYQKISNNDDDDEEHKTYDNYYNNNNNNNRYKGKGKPSYKAVFIPKEELFLENVKLIKYKSLRNM